MSRIRRILVIALAVALIMVSAGSLTALAQEERTLTIWQYALVSPEEMETPEDQWTISRICREFEAANPGVKIEMVLERDQNLLQNKLKAATLAKNAPDIANIFSGYLVTTLSDVLMDIKDLIPEEDREMIIGWEALAHDLDVNNAIYGYPAAGAELGLLIYNKDLVAQAGVDLEGEGRPKNAQEFMDAMRKIQAAGIQPIVARDGGWNGAFMFSFGNWWTQQSGPERVTSNSLGLTKFADDEGYLSSIALMADMYKEGILNKDYMSIPDAEMVFFMGDAAMLVAANRMVSTAITQMGEDKVGIFIAPNFVDDVPYQNATIGGVGQALCVTSSCKDPQLAVDFLSFFSSKKNAIDMCVMQSKLPQRTDITAEDIGWAGRPVYEKMLAVTAENLFPWNDNSMQSDVMNDYYKQTGLAVIGTITPLESALALDATAAQAAAAK